VSETRLYLFDDRRARRWAPFTLTRPAGELRYGCLTARERAEIVMGAPCAGHLTRTALAGFDEPGAAPVVEPDEVPGSVTRVLLSSRAVPDFQPAPETGRHARLVMGGETVGWILPPGVPTPAAATLLDPGVDGAGAAVRLPGEVLEWPWHLVRGTPRRIDLDVAGLFRYDAAVERVVRVGAGTLSTGEGAEIEPGVVVDTRGGPVRLDDGVRVEGPARLIGPLYVGRDTLVFGGSVGTSSIGPVCKVRGEVADSVLLGFSNKAHDGFLGHALLGRWVNLGAFTTNSDLKNNYGTIRVWTLDGERDTGLIKVGCFLGDHVKTGIGTVLNTGSVVGAGSNVFGGLMPPKVVPPFSWGAGADLGEYRFDRFVEAAEAVMARRSEALTPGVRAVLERAFHATRPGARP
jgi:UDP-N-acetylglucosamine diphosphorylase/glucosamine-1-phosphate N-acetyltransferase